MKTKQRTGAHALVEALQKVGAELVFGYPGGNVDWLESLVGDSHRPLPKYREILFVH